MKNLIVQVCIPNTEKVYDIGKGSMFAYIPDLYKKCSQDAQEYAANIGADYYLMTSPEFNPDLHSCYQRYSFFSEAYDDYDNILQVDGDYAPVPNAPDIFDIVSKQDEIWFAVPDNKFDKTGKMKPMRKVSFDNYELDEDFYYFNIGFYVMKKEARKIIRDNLPNYWSAVRNGRVFHDQDLLNKMVHDLFPDRYKAMNKNWNGVFAVKGADFGTHYAGMAKQRFTNEFHEELKKEKMSRSGGEIWHVPQYSTDRMINEI